MKYVLALLLSLMIGQSFAAAQEQTPKTLVTFAAMGDVPYSPEEYELLPKQIAEIPAEAQFVVHVGDIKTGKTLCEESIYENVAAILAKSTKPLFIIPGDNEWNDCIDPDNAWKLWVKHFARFDERWKHKIPVRRQPEHDENFAFVEAGVQFMGLNIVGGRVHDPNEWKRRHADDLKWTKKNLDDNRFFIKSVIIFGHAKPIDVHDDYFDGLSHIATKLEKPVLYLQGDGHRWIYDRPFKAQNILRVQVDQGGIAPPILVTVTDDPKEPFVIDRRLPK